MNKILAIVFAVTLISCSGSKPTEKLAITDTTVTAKPNPFNGVLVLPCVGDTVLDTVLVDSGKNSIRIYYNPSEKKLSVACIPDTIQIPGTVITRTKIDTVKVQEDYPFLSKMGWMAIGLCITVIIFLLFKFIL